MIHNWQNVDKQLDHLYNISLRSRFSLILTLHFLLPISWWCDYTYYKVGKNVIHSASSNLNAYKSHVLFTQCAVLCNVMWNTGHTANPKSL